MAKNKDYHNGKIYCIRNYIDDDIYVGSTTQSLCKRMSRHRNRMTDNTRIHTPLYSKINDIGIDKFYIELLEDYPCDSIEQLRQREGHYIREIGTLNVKIAGRSKQGWKEDNMEHVKLHAKEYHEQNKEKHNEQNKIWREEHPEEMKEYKKKWYENNREEMLLRYKERYENNKEEINLKNKEYREKHKEQLNEYFKNYREQNKDKIREREKIRITCACGVEIRKAGKSKHEKTNLDQNHLEQFYRFLP